MEGHTDGFPNLTAHVYFVFSLLPAFLSSSFIDHQRWNAEKQDNKIQQESWEENKNAKYSEN